MPHRMRSGQVSIKARRRLRTSARSTVPHSYSTTMYATLLATTLLAVAGSALGQGAYCAEAGRFGFSTVTPSTGLKGGAVCERVPSRPRPCPDHESIRRRLRSRATSPARTRRASTRPRSTTSSRTSYVLGGRPRLANSHFSCEDQQQRLRARGFRRAPHEPGPRRHLPGHRASARPVPAPPLAHTPASQIPYYPAYFPNASYSLLTQLTYPVSDSASGKTSYIVGGQTSTPISIVPNVS
jgi:hypothetical protein